MKPPSLGPLPNTLTAKPMDKVLREWSGRPGFNLRLSHTKDSKMVFDAALLSTQYYKVKIKGKVEQSWECSSIIGVGHPRLRSPSLLLLTNRTSAHWCLLDFFC